MTGRSHILVSGIYGAALAARFDMSPVYVLASIIGGLFPDTDCRHSLLGRWFPLWLLIKPHRRNITHSFVGLFLFSICFLWIPTGALFFAVGYLTHLMLDVFNKQGIPLWWPNKHLVTVANIKVGGFGEGFIVFLFYIIIISVLSWV